MAATGRQHSVTKGWFGEAKRQQPLSGCEIDKGNGVSRPIAEVEHEGALGLLHTPKLTMQNGSQSM
jgi:hypothetical protein